METLGKVKENLKKNWENFDEFLSMLDIFEEIWGIYWILKFAHEIWKSFHSCQHRRPLLSDVQKFSKYSSRSKEIKINSILKIGNR